MSQEGRHRERRRHDDAWQDKRMGLEEKEKEFEKSIRHHRQSLFLQSIDSHVKDSHHSSNHDKDRYKPLESAFPTFSTLPGTIG